MRRLLDWLTWLMFLVSFVVVILTLLVAFGLAYISRFTTFLPVEASLAATFILWGINSLINPYIKNSKYAFLYSAAMGGGLIVFILLGIY